MLKPYSVSYEDPQGVMHLFCTYAANVTEAIEQTEAVAYVKKIHHIAEEKQPFDWGMEEQPEWLHQTN